MGIVLDVQLIPSGDVITLLLTFPPEDAIATNNIKDELQHIEDQLISAAELLITHANPSVDVITLLFVVVYDVLAELPTATNKLNSGLQQTELQNILSIAAILVVI